MPLFQTGDVGVLVSVGEICALLPEAWRVYGAGRQVGDGRRRDSLIRIS
ncbi:hypothetical protein AKJ09_04012 [Labilithrix luteola]|uniref:Uncharacterized protein n=1 Tax=Labilithrix luteola TaxID=1391654 RepID=A0A0K1PUZ0_9BACT|nr:hypothetical protein AKJ09_04012 [Labilithrix luteola]